MVSHACFDTHQKTHNHLFWHLFPTLSHKYVKSKSKLVDVSDLIFLLLKRGQKFKSHSCMKLLFWSELYPLLADLCERELI